MSQSERIALNLAAELNQLRTEIILERTAELIEATPVDTSWARANWIPSVGEPPTEPVGSPNDVGAAQNAQAAGIAAVLANRDGEAELAVTNHVGYLEQLNKGTSPQAEANFIEHAIEKADNTVMARLQTRKVEL